MNLSQWTLPQFVAISSVAVKLSMLLSGPLPQWGHHLPAKWAMNMLTSGFTNWLQKDITSSNISQCTTISSKILSAILNDTLMYSCARSCQWVEDSLSVFQTIWQISTAMKTSLEYKMKYHKWKWRYMLWIIWCTYLSNILWDISSFDLIIARQSIWKKQIW